MASRGTAGATHSSVAAAAVGGWVGVKGVGCVGGFRCRVACDRRGTYHELHGARQIAPRRGGANGDHTRQRRTTLVAPCVRSLALPHLALPLSGCVRTCCATDTHTTRVLRAFVARVLVRAMVTVVGAHEMCVFACSDWL